MNVILNSLWVQCMSNCMIHAEIPTRTLFNRFKNTLLYPGRTIQKVFLHSHLNLTHVYCPYQNQCSPWFLNEIFIWCALVWVCNIHCNKLDKCVSIRFFLFQCFHSDPPVLNDSTQLSLNDLVGARRRRSADDSGKKIVLWFNGFISQYCS
jgi:hypothetical protein